MIDLRIDENKIKNLWIKDRLKEWMNKWIFNQLINDLNLGSGERST